MTGVCHLLVWATAGDDGVARPTLLPWQGTDDSLQNHGRTEVWKHFRRRPAHI